MGYRGTWSRMIFYNLDKLKEGDRVVLKDRTGRPYEYRVCESFLADPADSWVMGQVRGRDMVTLQTCTPYPTFEKRLIVRADRV
jgi:sortase A